MPHTGLKNIRGDSNYLLFIDLARYLTKQGHYVYMYMPRFAKDSVDRFPGLAYIFKDYDYDFYTEYGLVDIRTLAEKFSRTVGKYFIDVIITAMASQVPFYQVALSDYVHQRDVPCMVIEPAVYQEQKTGMHEHQLRGRMSFIFQALGFAYSTPIFLAPHEKANAMENAKKCLSGSDVKRIDRNARIVSVGVPCDYVNEETKDITEKYDKFTLFFGGRLNSVKNPASIFDLYSKFVQSGKNAQIKVTSNTGQVKFFAYGDGYKAYQKVKDVIDITYQCPREDYVKIAKRSHVAIAWSRSEGFPVGFWEQMYMGLPLLFKNERWVRAQIPDWYPWVFDTKNQAYAMLLDLYENYDKVVPPVMDRMKEFIEENYNSNKIHATIEVELDRMYNLPEQYKSIKSIRKLIVDGTSVFKPGTKVTVNDMIRMLGKLGRSFPEDSRHRTLNAKFPRDYEIYRMMLEIGYKDTFRSPIPELIVPDLEGK